MILLNVMKGFLLIILTGSIFLQPVFAFADVESKTNPTDVNDHTPEFSAIYNDQNGGDYGTWYRIQVSTSSLGAWADSYWDSGTSTMATTTESNRSPQISYSGSLLASSTTYYWRIKFSDDDRKEGAWSTATSTFYIDTSCNCATAIDDMEKQLYLHYIYYHCTKKKHPDCPEGSVQEKYIDGYLASYFEENLKISESLRDWCVEKYEPAR